MTYINYMTLAFFGCAHDPAPSFASSECVSIDRRCSQMVPRLRAQEHARLGNGIQAYEDAAAESRGSKDCQRTFPSSAVRRPHLTTIASSGIRTSRQRSRRLLHPPAVRQDQRLLEQANQLQCWSMGAQLASSSSPAADRCCGKLRARHIEADGSRRVDRCDGAQVA